MKITILGAGEVGTYLAARLSQEGHNVTIVEQDEALLERIAGSLDVMAVKESFLNAEGLKKIGVGSSDVMIAITANDEINILSSHICKDMGVTTTIARVGSLQTELDGYSFSFDKLGVDKVIYPEQIAAEDIVTIARSGKYYSRIMSFANKKLHLLRVRVQAGDHMDGKSVREIREHLKNESFLMVLVLRKGQNIIPRGEFVVTDGDKVYLMLRTHEYSRVLRGLGIQIGRNKRLMIVGGGDVSCMAAQSLEKHFSSVKIIEKDRAQCDLLAERLNSSIVLHGDGTDVQLLLSENIGEVDIFIAASNDDKENLLAGLLARNNGAKKTVCLLHKADYISLVDELGLDHVVVPKVSISNEILKEVREGKIVSVMTIPDTGAEIIDQEVTRADCLLTTAPLKKLALPDNVLIGAVIKNGSDIIIPDGDYCFEVGDRAVVFSDADHTKQVEGLFK